MAYALVGTAGTVSTGTSGAAVTPAYGAGASRTANNLLVLQVVSTGSATLPAAISGWSIAKQQAGTSCSASIYYKIAAGADAAPAVPIVASAIHNARLLEFSGGVTATPLDQSAGVAGTTTPLVATAAGVDVGIGDLVIGSGGAINSAARTNTMTHTINNAASDVETSNGATSTASHYDFTYGFTTTKAAANSDSFAFQTTQLTGAVIALASFKIPVTVFTDSGSGTGTLSGSSVESYGFFFNDSRSGAIVAGAVGSHETFAPYDSVIDEDIPVSHWKLGTSTAFDRWRTSDLTPNTGPVPATTGLISNNGTDGASQFDVTTGWFRRGASTDIGLPYNTSAWTMEAWARVDVVPSSSITIMARGPSNPSGISVSSAGAIRSSFNDGTSAFTSVLVSTLVLGRTYHLVQTWDGTNQRLYVDGALVETNARSGSKSVLDDVPQVGGILSGTGSVVIDEAAWYATALSDARVLAHYQAGKATAYDAVIDADSPVSHWKLGWSTTKAVDRKRVYSNQPAVSGPIATTKGIVWQADNDLANIFVPASNQRFGLLNQETGSGTTYDTPQWSIEAWVRLSSTSIGTFVQQRADLTGGRNIRIVSPAKIGTEYYDTGGTSIQAFAPASSYSALTNVHVVGTYDGANLIVYLNGVERARTASTAPPRTAADFFPTIGGNGATADGVVDEAAWYPTALTPARVRAHFLAGLPGYVTVGGTGVENYVPPAVSGLTDTFDTTLDTAKWTSFGAGVSVSGGQLRITYHIGSLAGVRSNNTYSISGSSVFAKIAPYTHTTALEANFYVMLANGNYVGFRQYVDDASGFGSSSLRFDYDAGAGRVTVDSLDYQENLMRWWRIREAGGTCYWDTSIDGVTWTNRASVAWPLSSKNVQVVTQVRANGADPPGVASLDSVNVPGTAVQAISTFSDAFDTLDTAKWIITGGPPVITSGQLHMPLSVADYSILDSLNYYEMLEQSAHVEVVHIDPTVTDLEADFIVWAVSSGHLSFWIYVDDASTNSLSLSFAYRSNATAANNVISIPYDPVAHRWLRFRNQSGNAYWDTSPDGATWTNRRNVAWPVDQTIVQVEFYAARTTPTSDDTIYDNFNVVSGIVYNDSASGTVNASGTKTETLTYDDSGSGTVTVAGTGAGTLYSDSSSGTITTSGTAVESYSYTDSRTGTGTVSGTRTESYVFSDSTSGTATASGTVTESAVYADARTCPLAGSGTGIESYVVIPSVTFVSQSGTKISRVASQDAVNVVWSVDKNFTSYQFRIVSSPTAPVSAGVLLEQDQSPASGGTATTQYTSTITDDELVAAAGAEGSNLLKIFVQSATGDWST